jgi:haloalkane dehalogenase
MQRRTFVSSAILSVTARGSLSLRALYGQADLARDLEVNTTSDRLRAFRYVETPQGRIAVREAGRGPGALFLHGFPLNSYQWRDVMHRLAESRRCIAPDFLGLGFTDVAPGQALDPDAQVEMLVALLDALRESRVDVIANDSGGAVAQLLVARHPARVRSLLLTNCDTQIDCPPPALQPVFEMARRKTYVEEWLAPWLADASRARGTTGLGGMTYTNPANLTNDAIEIYLGPLVRAPDRTHAFTLALDRNVLAGIEPALRRFTGPSGVLWGSGDPIFSAESPAYLARTLGNCRRVRIVPKARLFFPEEYPALVANEARRLWAES